MEVILKEDVEKLGEAGKKVKVTGGYARNYLIPQGLAILATKSNINVIELHMKVREKKLEALKEKAQVEADKLSPLHLVFERKTGEEGKLYGSVTSGDIYAEIVKNNIEIDKRKILLDMPIKELGEHKVKIKVHPEVTAEITVEVKAEIVEGDGRLEEPAEAPAEEADAADSTEEETDTETPPAE